LPFLAKRFSLQPRVAFPCPQMPPQPPVPPVLFCWRTPPAISGAVSGSLSDGQLHGATGSGFRSIPCPTMLGGPLQARSPGFRNRPLQDSLRPSLHIFRPFGSVPTFPQRMFRAISWSGPGAPLSGRNLVVTLFDPPFCVCEGSGTPLRGTARFFPSLFSETFGRCRSPPNSEAK